jgi:ArsR family transcriptional regulator
MSKQAAVSTPTKPDAPVPYCPPLAVRPLDGDTAAALAPAFKALGDPMRLQLMSMIASANGGEICVCELTPAFTLSGPTISHHLRSLREAGLVTAERRGTWVYYRPRPGLLRQLAALLAVDHPGAPDTIADHEKDA